jgi:hypothetical protein
MGRLRTGSDRVIRGGNANDPAENARSPNRNRNDPSNRNDTLGLRPVAPLDGSPDLSPEPWIEVQAMFHRMWEWKNLEHALWLALRGKRDRPDGREFVDILPDSLAFARGRRTPRFVFRHRIGGVLQGLDL